MSLLINFLILGSKVSTYTVQRYKPSAYMFNGGSENGHFTQLLCRFLKSCTLARTKATYTAFRIRSFAVLCIQKSAESSRVYNLQKYPPKQGSKKEILSLDITTKSKSLLTGNKSVLEMSCG